MKYLFSILLGLLLIFPYSVFAISNTENITSVIGKILIQVESKGEAWYVNPTNKQRYYLGRPADAFEVMRKQGTGISEKDILSMFTPDQNDFRMMRSNKGNSLLGKIILRVERAGEAYYVEPKTGYAYFLGRPQDAFNIMKGMGLGISNIDLNKIVKSSDGLQPRAISSTPQVDSNDVVSVTPILFAKDLTDDASISQKETTTVNIPPSSKRPVTDPIAQIPPIVQPTPVQVVLPPQPTKPEITRFEADKATASIGDVLTLNWETKNAITCATTETQDISIPFVGRLPNGSTSFALQETGYEKIPNFIYYLICADKDWNTTVKQLSVSINHTWKIVPHFDTNDAWNYGTANNHCGLNLTDTSSPNGGISGAVDEVWPNQAVFSTLRLNVGNNEQLTGLSLQSVTLKKAGTANLADIDLSISTSPSGISGNIPGILFNKQSVDGDTLLFTVPSQNGLTWPFNLNVKFDPTGMKIGDTLGLSIIDIKLATSNQNDTVIFPLGLPAKSESPDLVVRCATKSN